MAYYMEDHSKMRYGEISHFRQPYKDYTSLGDDAAVAPNIGGVNSNLVAGIWYVNDPVFAAKLATMDTQPFVSGVKSNGVDQTSMLLVDGGGQLQPDNNASHWVSGVVEYGYAAILSALDDGQQFIVLTKDPDLIVQIAGQKSGSLGAVLIMPPDLGLEVSAMTGAMKPATPTLTTAKASSSSLGPIGVTLVVLGAAWASYYAYKHFAKKRRIA